ncbi:unnamed protein product, partial [Amoebophrya sp. A25]
RLIALRTNPLENIEGRLRRLPEHVKTQRISEWLNTYADEPSPVSYNPTTGVYKSSIDTIDGWAQEATEERDKARKIYHLGTEVLNDVKADRERADKALKRVIDASLRLQDLKDVQKRLRWTLPLNQFCTGTEDMQHLASGDFSGT